MRSNLSEVSIVVEMEYLYVSTTFTPRCSSANIFNVYVLNDCSGKFTGLRCTVLPSAPADTSRSPPEKTIIDGSNLDTSISAENSNVKTTSSTAIFSTVLFLTICRPLTLAAKITAFSGSVSCPCSFVHEASPRSKMIRR